MSGVSPDDVLNSTASPISSSTATTITTTTVLSTTQSTLMTTVATDISHAAAMAIDPLISHVGDGVFLQTKTAQGLAGICVWVALFITCQQVINQKSFFFYFFLNSFPFRHKSEEFPKKNKTLFQFWWEKRTNNWKRLNVVTAWIFDKIIKERENERNTFKIHITNETSIRTHIIWSVNQTFIFNWGSLFNFVLKSFYLSRYFISINLPYFDAFHFWIDFYVCARGIYFLFQ